MSHTTIIVLAALTNLIFCNNTLRSFAITRSHIWTLDDPYEKQKEGCLLQPLLIKFAFWTPIKHPCNNGY